MATEYQHSPRADNQPTLHDALRRNLDEMILENFKGVRHGFVQTVDGDHSGVETRRVWVTDQLDEWLKTCCGERRQKTRDQR